MAQFTAQCPHCKQQFTAQTEWIGQQANCPTCGKLFTITNPIQSPRAIPETNQSFKAQCPYCKQHFDAQTEWIGQQTNCPSCGNNFTITKSTAKEEFLEIIKNSKTLIPDMVILGIFLICFILYLYGLLDGISKFSEHLTKTMGSSIYSPLDIFTFNVPLKVARYDLFFGLYLEKFIDHVLMFVLLGTSGCYLAKSILNRTIFRKIEIVAAINCLALVLIVFLNVNCDVMRNLKRNLDGTFSIAYFLSTIFFLFLLIFCTLCGAIWRKYKLYLQECSDGERIGFMDFIKKFLKWEML